LAGVLIGCSESSVGEIASPTTAPIVGPQFTPIPAGGVTASWLEPLAAGGYAFRFARFRNESWSVPQTIVADDSIYFHPTEVPSVLTLADGTLVAAWQRKAARGRSRFENDILVARSLDQGASWSAPAMPYRDRRGGEHGFVSLFARDSSTAGLVWLDSRLQRSPIGTR
jgi:hypothetical protein